MSKVEQQIHYHTDTQTQSNGADNPTLPLLTSSGPACVTVACYSISNLAGGIPSVNLWAISTVEFD